MKLAVLAAVAALAITPAFAQNDMSSDSSMSKPMMHHSQKKMHHANKKMHHSKMMDKNMSMSECKNMVETTDTQKPQKCM